MKLGITFTLAILAMGGSVCLAADNVLIYSDCTPGSIINASTFEEVAWEAGYDVTTVYDPDDFLTKLWGGKWAGVQIAARYTKTEPVWAKDLRTWSGKNPYQLVEMMLWHDAGDEPYFASVVLATTAVVTWGLDTTSINYAYGTDLRTPDQWGMPTVLEGFQMPDFGYIQPYELDTILCVPAKLVAGLSQVQVAQVLAAEIGERACERNCSDRYKSDYATCDANLTTDTTQCDELYPNRENDGGEAVAHAACTKKANTNHSNCTTAAAGRLDDCLAVCKKNDPDPQPEPEPNGMNCK